jgi:hypothetical protein
MNRNGKLVVIAILVATAYAGYATWQGARGFNPTMIDKIKQEIRDDFTGKGNTVVDVDMRRGGQPRHLAGTVSFKAAGSEQPQQKACTATLAADDSYRWNCE